MRPSLRALGAGGPGKRRSAVLSVFKYTFVTRAWPTWQRYTATAAIVLAALLPRLALQAWFPGSPFLLFFLAIILSAALFDHGSGIVAVLLSAAAVKWFLLEPKGSLNITRVEDIFALSIFIAIGIVSAAILEALHKVAADLADANDRLIAAEGEKDLLLQEASHRFKNELTMIYTMLRLQERSLDDRDAKAALASSADRVQVLGRIHERLQRSNIAAVVDSRQFIFALCDDLRLAIELRPIALDVDAESHLLTQERAVPVGLAINELLTNALKYAFPDERKGKVEVKFVREDGDYCLSVTDNGIGTASTPNSSGSGLGLRLIRSMALQLGGSVEVTSAPQTPGTSTVMRFPV